MITAKNAWRITRENREHIESVNFVLDEINNLIEDACVETDNIYYEFTNPVSDTAKNLINKKLQEYGYITTLSKGWDDAILGVKVSWADCE